MINFIRILRLLSGHCFLLLSKRNISIMNGLEKRLIERKLVRGVCGLKKPFIGARVQQKFSNRSSRLTIPLENLNK